MMDRRTLARRLAGLLCSLVLLEPLMAQAQRATCETYDLDGNGRVEASDAAPLIAEHSLLASCRAVDLTAALGCRSFDANGDGAVSTLDQAALHAEFQRFLACLEDPSAPEGACADLDADANGRVTLLDFPVVEARFQAFRGCVSIDLSVLACGAVDYDGDERISNVDQSLFSERLAAFGECFGSSIGGADGFFVSRSQLARLPTAGRAWQSLLEEAEAAYLAPDLGNQDGQANTRTWAQALVGVRLAREDLIEEVRRALREISERAPDPAWSTLAVGRELLAYVLAADLIELSRRDPDLDRAFRARLESLREAPFQGRTLVSTHEDRPNNWGTHAGATRVAIALYLGDGVDLAAAAAVHRGWLGERAAYAGFRFGPLSWQEDEQRPVGVNRVGARRDGIDLDGSLPEEMRRGGPLAEPPAHTGYAWEALQGATVTTELLARNGYPDAWRWGGSALLRAVDYLARLDAAQGGWWARGDDRWNVWLVNHGTGRAYRSEAGVGPGKNLGFTDWTHAPGS